MAASGWFDPGSTGVKTVQALGLVVLIFGLVAGLVLMLIGGIRCREVWRRRTVNRRGVAGLLIVLAGWLLVYVGGGLAFTVYRVAFGPMLGVAVLCFLAGIGVALSGLGQMRRHPKWFNYGRGHAVAAVWGGVLPLAALAALAGVMLWVYRADLGMLRLLAKGHYESGWAGYRVKLSGGLWKSWPEGAERVGDAEFAVLGMMGDQGLFVMPVWLAGRREVDMGALAAAMLAEVGQRADGPMVHTVPPPIGSLEEERHFAVFVPKEKSGILYRYRVAALGGMGYLVGAWMDQRQGASQERLDEAVMRVSLVGNAAKKDVEPGGEAGSPALRARLYRRMVENLTRRGLSKEAQWWGAEAQKLDGGSGVAAAAVPASDAGLASAIFALGAGDGGRALELAGNVLRGEPTNYVAVATKGIALGLAGKVGEGLRVVEAAQKGAPGDASLCAAIDFLRCRKAGDAGAVLGEALDPVGVPESLFRVEEPTEEARAAGVGYDWAVTALRFRRAEPLVFSRYGRVRVFSEAGGKAFKTIVEAFDPAMEVPHLNRAVVLDAEGKEVRKIDVGSWRVEADGGEGLARLVGEAGVLGAGQAVEWAVTFRRAAPALRVPYWSHCFSRAMPVRRSALWVDGDFRSVAATSSRGVPRPVGQPKPHWILENPPAQPEGEWFLPPRELYLPHVWFGEADRAWAQLAADYLDLLRGALVPDDKVRGAVAKVTAGAEGDDAKIAALARFVQAELKPVVGGYRALGHLPGPPGETLLAREGDSGGHATLLHALLNAAGIESSLALVRVGGLFHEGIPSLDHFDRMLVFVPGLPQQYVDCYEKAGDPLGGLPADVAGRRALVLDPKGPGLKDVPSAPAMATILLHRRVNLLEGGEMEIEEEAQIQGAVPRLLAERIGWGGGEGAFARSFVAEAKGVTVNGFEVSGGGYQRPVRVKLTAKGRAGGGRVPALLETLIFDPGPVAERRGPAWLGSAVAVRGTLEVLRGGAAVALPKLAVNLVGRRLVGCAFVEGPGFSYAVERVPGFVSAENFRRMGEEVREVFDVIEPRADVPTNK